MRNRILHSHTYKPGSSLQGVRGKYRDNSTEKGHDDRDDPVSAPKCMIIQHLEGIEGGFGEFTGLAVSGYSFLQVEVESAKLLVAHGLAWVVVQP